MIPLSPDGYFYLQDARGELVPKPYSRRWLLPYLLGSDPRNWKLLTHACLALIPMNAFYYASAFGLKGWSALFATALICAQPGLRLSLRYPVLNDAPAFMLALCTAGLAHEGHIWPAVMLSLWLGAMRESAPVFAALWAWSPWPLLGLLAAGWFRKSAPSDIPWLAHPMQEAWKKRREIGLDGNVYFWPLGGALAGLTIYSWQTALTVTIASAQLFIAQDTLRLLVWCAPVLCVGATTILPSILWILTLLITIFYQTSKA